MNPEELKKKYGAATVLGVDKSVIDVMPARGMVTRRIDPQLTNVIELIGGSLRPQLRCEAELDPNFKQIIPYVMLRNSCTGDVYTTTRLGGDSRLRGKLSFGLGGHMDEGETFIPCLLRELREEVGLTDCDIDNIMLYGYLYSDTTEVDSVHLGVVYVVDTHRTDIRCLEADKLCGAWFNLSQLMPFREAGLMESWSEMLFDALVCEERLIQSAMNMEEFE